MLNKEQLQASEINDSRVLVLAGPGTGKTTTLVSRYKHLISEGNKPEEIICCTFSRKAVDEIGSDTLSFMNNNPGNFGYSSLLGGSGSDLDLEGISTNVEEIAPAINALSQQIVSVVGGGGSSIINNVVNNYGSGGKPGEGGGESNGGDFSDSGLDSFRMHYLGSLM